MSIRKMKCDEHEMRRIVAEYGTQLLRFCEMYLGDRQLAEDAVQETFFLVHEKYGTFAGKSSELTWITRIAINQCKNIRRKKHFQYEILGYEQNLSTPLEDKNDPQSLVEEVKNLPPKEREAILMYYYQEMEIKEIAALCKTSEAAVRQRLKRGRDRLKTILERMGFDGQYKKTD